MPNMKGSEFLKMVSKIKKFTVLEAEFNEENNENESFDNLFSESYMRFSQIDSEIITSHLELEVIESWFEGRSIKLEKLYRGSEDKFNGTSY